MIDRFLYAFFGLLDKVCSWMDSLFNLFNKKKKKKKENKSSPEDLFNGE